MGVSLQIVTMKHLIFLLPILQGTFLICLASQDVRRPYGGILRSTCVDTTPVCLNCQTVLVCSEDPPTEFNCGACQLVCGEGGPVAACYKGYDHTNATLITNDVCLCETDDGNILANGGYQDPFDATYYVNCSGGVPSYMECPSGNIYNEVSQVCVSGYQCPPTSEPKEEDPLNCNSYIDCSNGGTLETCSPSTFIFDEDAQSCVDPMATVCENATAGQMIQNPDVCYMTITCAGDPLAIVSEMCCDRGQYFSDVTFECLAITSAEEAICDTPLCIQEYWEQLYCNECVDATTVYATRDICSNYYYECVDDGSGGFIPTLTQCPASFPTWDPLNNYCDVEDSVVGCQ